jgi:AraC-like DNA-binding protein
MAEPTLPDFVSLQVTEARRFFLNLRPETNTGLVVVCGGVERMRPDYALERREFPYYCIECVAEGFGQVIQDEVKTELSPGSVFAYGPKTHLSIRSSDRYPMRKHYVDFVGTESLTWLAESGLIDAEGRFTCLSVRAVHEISELFDLLYRSGEDGRSHPNEIQRCCQRILELVFLKIHSLRLPAGQTMSQSFATFEKIRQHIDDHHLSITTIEQVAEEFKMTAVHVSRLFARYADCGAYQYLQKRRMNYAAGLLMSEGLLVKEVALRMRFADPFQFSRTFKRVYGVPPKDLIAKRKS